MNIFSILEYFDWTLLPRTLLNSYRHGRQHGESVAEAAAGSIVGTNTATLFAPLYGRHDGRTITRILQRNGIDTWGWFTHDDTQCLHVHESDRVRAMQVLKAEGVELW